MNTNAMQVLLFILLGVWLIATVNLIRENERLLLENKSYKEEVVSSKADLSYCLKEIRKLVFEGETGYGSWNGN
jgi:hypothetical protein